MQGWLAEAMRVARGTKSHAHIADLTGAHQQTVSRWEEGETWPRDLDSILAAYAQAGNLEGGPRAMWELAIDLWQASDAATPSEAPETVAEEAARQREGTPLEDAPSGQLPTPKGRAA